MGVYTENIFNLSLNDHIRNIKKLEMKVADNNEKIKRYENGIKIPEKSKTCLRRSKSGNTNSTLTFVH